MPSLLANSCPSQTLAALHGSRTKQKSFFPNESTIINNTEDLSTLKLINSKAIETGSTYTVKIINQLGEATLNVSCN